MWEPIETFATAVEAADAGDLDLNRFLVWLTMPDGSAMWAEAWIDADGRPTGAFEHTNALRAHG